MRKDWFVQTVRKKQYPRINFMCYVIHHYLDVHMEWVKIFTIHEKGKIFGHDFFIWRFIMKVNFTFSSVSRFKPLSLIQQLEAMPYGLSGQSHSTNNNKVVRVNIWWTSWICRWFWLFYEYLWVKNNLIMS